MSDDLDYILKVGLDTSKLKDADKEVRKKLEPTMRRMEQSDSKRLKLQNARLAVSLKEIQLSKRQLAIETKIRDAEKRGAAGFSRIRRIAGQGDIKSVAEAELLLSQKLLAFNTRNTKELAKAKAEQIALAEAKAKTLKEEKASAKIQRSTRFWNPPKDPDTNISYQSRTSLQERIKNAANSKYAVTDDDLRARVAAAKNALRNLNKEVTDTSSLRSLLQMRMRYAEIAKEISGAVRDQQRLNAAMAQGSALSQGLRTGSMRFLGAMGFGGGAAAIGGIASALIAKNIYSTGKALDSMQASLLAASGGAEQAEEDFKYLERTSVDLGKSLTTMVGGYNKIAIAGRTAGYSAEQIKNIFMAASEASTAYGLSQERTNLVMLAFSQMMNKGKVSMEEISTQLGETLPGAVTLGAKSMGYANDEVGKFIKDVSSGTLLTKDFIHNFSTLLREEIRVSGAYQAGKKKLQAEEQRFLAVYQSMVKDVFDESAASTFATVISDVTSLLTKAGPALKGFFGGFFDGLRVVWDLGVAIVDVMATLIKQLFTLGTGNGGKFTFLNAMKGILHSIAAIIYEIISAMYSLNDFLSRPISSFFGGKAATDHAVNSGKSASKGSSVSEVNVHVDARGFKGDEKKLANYAAEAAVDRIINWGSF